jgi:phage terminase large subunit-like protein
MTIDLFKDKLPTVYKYCEDIENGTIASGDNIKLAVKRFKDDLLRDDLKFKVSKVKKVITFVNSLKHFTGKFNNVPFILEGWQEFIVANLYGFYWKHDNTRRFTEAIIEVARKNGKTELAAALALYHMMFDDEADAEIVFAANSRSQAKVGFKAVSKFSGKIDPDRKYIKAYRNEAKYDGNIIKVVAAKAEVLDGLNCSAVIQDEGHAAKNNDVYDVLKSSQGARENPMFISISTAGSNKLSPFYALRSTAIEVVHGVKTDDSLFAVIYELNEGDDWKDEANWIKCNPNLNVSVRPAYIRGEIIKALNSNNLEVGVKTKHLNMWCDSAITWIPSDVIIKSTGEIIDGKRVDINIKDFKGEYCWTGVDLGSNCDITATSTMFIKDGKNYWFFRFYLPQAMLANHSMKIQYALWAKQGYLTITPGNVTDYDYVLADLKKQYDDYDMLSVSFDDWNSTQFNISATEAGLPMTQFSQALGNFNIPTKTFERMALLGTAVLENNPIIRWMFGNVVLRTDGNGNVKPSKMNKNSPAKIDGVISALQALGTYLTAPRYV